MSTAKGYFKQIPASEVDDTNYQQLASTVQFDRESWTLHIGDRDYQVEKGKEPIFGSKKVVYHLAGEPHRVRKTIQTESTPDRPPFNLHAKFKAMYQAITREYILDRYDIPHLKITDISPGGEPYTDYEQEAVPEGALFLAELIKSGTLDSQAISQIATYVNLVEGDKEWQLDTNPYNWFELTDQKGNKVITYADGKVYPYDPDWGFKRIGLLQYLDPKFLSSNGIHTAQIPTEADYLELQKRWKTDDPALAIWKATLNPLMQP